MLSAAGVEGREPPVTYSVTAVCHMLRDAGNDITPCTTKVSSLWHVADHPNQDHLVFEHNANYATVDNLVEAASAQHMVPPACCIYPMPDLTHSLPLG